MTGDQARPQSGPSGLSVRVDRRVILREHLVTCQLRSSVRARIHGLAKLLKTTPLNKI